MVAESVEEGNTEAGHGPLDGLDPGEGGKVDDVAGQKGGVDLPAAGFLQDGPEDFPGRRSSGGQLAEESAVALHVPGGLGVAPVAQGHVAVGEVKELEVALEPLDEDGGRCRRRSPGARFFIFLPLLLVDEAKGGAATCRSLPANC